MRRPHDWGDRARSRAGARPRAYAGGGPSRSPNGDDHVLRHAGDRHTGAHPQAATRRAVGRSRPRVRRLRLRGGHRDHPRPRLCPAPLRRQPRPVVRPVGLPLAGPRDGAVPGHLHPDRPGHGRQRRPVGPRHVGAVRDARLRSRGLGHPRVHRLADATGSNASTARTRSTCAGRPHDSRCPARPAPVRRTHRSLRRARRTPRPTPSRRRTRRTGEPHRARSMARTASPGRGPASGHSGRAWLSSASAMWTTASPLLTRGASVRPTTMPPRSACTSRTRLPKESKRPPSRSPASTR